MTPNIYLLIIIIRKLKAIIMKSAITDSPQLVRYSDLLAVYQRSGKRRLPNRIDERNWIHEPCRAHSFLSVMQSGNSCDWWVGENEALEVSSYGPRANIS